MNRIERAIAEDGLTEKYIVQSQLLAVQCREAGLSSGDLKQFAKFSEFGQALKPADILDYVKRRSARKTSWRQTAEAWLEPLEEIRNWAANLSEDFSDRLYFLRVFIIMVGGALVALPFEQ